MCRGHSGLFRQSSQSGCVPHWKSLKFLVGTRFLQPGQGGRSGGSVGRSAAAPGGCWVWLWEWVSVDFCREVEGGKKGKAYL